MVLGLAAADLRIAADSSALLRSPVSLMPAHALLRSYSSKNICAMREGMMYLRAS